MAVVAHRVSMLVDNRATCCCGRKQGPAQWCAPKKHGGRPRCSSVRRRSSMACMNHQHFTYASKQISACTLCNKVIVLGRRHRGVPRQQQKRPRRLVTKRWSCAWTGMVSDQSLHDPQVQPANDRQTPRLHPTNVDAVQSSLLLAEANGNCALRAQFGFCPCIHVKRCSQNRDS